MAVNFRKAICKILKKGTGLYAAFDCKRYEPPIPPDPTIWVEVCAETLLLPNEWCPTREVRQFKPEEAPTETCRAHADPDPMVLVEVCGETGKAPREWCQGRTTIPIHQSALPLAPCDKHTRPRIPVFVGIYDRLVALGDKRLAFRREKQAGSEGPRIFIDCQWHWTGTQIYEYADYNEEIAEKIRYKNPAEPKDIQNDNGVMVYVRQSGRRFPLYDYDRPRAGFWNDLRETFEIIRDLNQTAWAVATDFCTLKTTGDDKYLSPWECAVQRMMPGIQNGIWGEQMKPWFRAHYKRIWDLGQAVGVRMIFEDMNEGDALGWDDAFMLSWFQWSNAMMRAMGIPKEKIVTTAARNVAAIANLYGYYSPHGIGRPDQIQEYQNQAVGKTLWSSDGWKQGTGEPGGAGDRGVGLDVAREIGEMIVQRGGLGFEFLPRMVYPDPNRANVDALTPEALEIISQIARG